MYLVFTYSDISAIYGKKSEKNLNASLQKEDKLTDTCAVTMFGSLPSIFSITSRSAPVIQLARSHKSFNVRCFFRLAQKDKSMFRKWVYFHYRQIFTFPRLET